MPSISDSPESTDPVISVRFIKKEHFKPSLKNRGCLQIADVLLLIVLLGTQETASKPAVNALLIIRYYKLLKIIESYRSGLYIEERRV